MATISKASADIPQVVDGLPIVNEEQKSKLIKFFVKKMNAVGRVKDADDSVFMPMNDQGMSEG
jgi:translation initiation factor 3 subunit B